MKGEKLERVRLGHGKVRHCTDKARFAFYLSDYSYYMEDGINKDETGRNAGKTPWQNPRQEFMRACTKITMRGMGKRKWVQGIFRAPS